MSDCMCFGLVKASRMVSEFNQMQYAMADLMEHMQPLEPIADVDSNKHGSYSVYTWFMSSKQKKM